MTVFPSLPLTFMMTDDCFLSLYFVGNLGKHVIYSLYASLRRERRHVSERVIAGGRAVQQVMPVFVFPETEAALFYISWVSQKILFFRAFKINELKTEVTNRLAMLEKRVERTCCMHT